MDIEFLNEFDRHLRVLQGLSDGTISLYRTNIKKFFEWNVNKNPDKKELADLTRQDIEAYLEYWFYQGNSNITRRAKLTALKKFFRFLMYENHIEKDITLNIPMPKIWSKFLQTFSREEILKIFSQIDITNEKGIRDVCIIILGVFAGLRVSEICNLSLNDIIDDGKYINLNIIDSKHHGNRIVSDLWKVPSVFIRNYFVIRLSQNARGQDPFIVSFGFKNIGNNQKLDGETLNKIFKNYVKKTQIRKSEVYMHMLRATYGTVKLCIKGEHYLSVGQSMGHKSIMTTSRYISSRDRIHKIYRSLAEYWSAFPSCWKGDLKDESIDKSGAGNGISDGK